MESERDFIAASDLRVAIVTGQSDPRCPALSAEQHALLDALDLPESCKVRHAFPFTLPCTSLRSDTEEFAAASSDRTVATSMPLWLASLRNLRQFAQASTPLFRFAHAESWKKFNASAPHFVFITGSCGLQFLNALGAVTTGQVRHVFALGPVAWKRPHLPHTLIQGERDKWSRLFFRRVDHQLPGVGHMDYYSQPLVAQIINEYLCNSIFR